jgi:hypothetical protein
MAPTGPPTSGRSDDIEVLLTGFGVSWHCEGPGYQPRWFADKELFFSAILSLWRKPFLAGSRTSSRYLLQVCAISFEQ